MVNELLLIVSLVLIYGSVLFFFYQFDEAGLYVWTAIATIAANIEVLILVDAFGMEQTLGNILFASTVLATDILSETKGRKVAGTAVKVGICTSFTFVLLSQSWFLYVPSANDFAMDSIQMVFSNTPRLMLVGIAVYAIAQTFDVWLYHALWEKTSEKSGDSKKGLWIRNNVSTLCSQFLNTVLFSFGAFWGVMEMDTIFSIITSSYVIFILTSLCDTPAIYLARVIHEKKQKPDYEWEKPVIHD